MMNNSLTHGDILSRWMKTLPFGTLVRCLGNTPDKLLAIADQYALAKLPENSQTLWELPLKGAPHCDLSFCYNREIMADNGFLHEEGRRIGALLWHLLNLMPGADLWSEVDTPEGEGKSQISSVFINVSEDLQLVLERTWARDAQPPQWQRIQGLVDKLGEAWKLHYIGLMPGREQNPLRLIFKRPEREKITEKAGVALVQELLERTGFGALPEDARAKLQQLESLGLQEWEVSFDLYPDGSFGKILGVEIALVEDERELTEIPSSRKWLDLQNCLETWGLADERIKFLPNLVGRPTLQFLGTNVRAFIYSFLSHVKLRWDADKPLAAKAYLAHEYSLV